MNFPIVVIFCFAALNGIVAGKRARIVGGQDASIYNFPYQVSFRIYELNEHFCSGSIISEYHILTAAHCFYRREDVYNTVRVFIGTNSPFENSGVRFRLTNVAVHPEFTGIISQTEAWNNDIAVTMTDGQIKFQSNQNKIDLPTQNLLFGSPVLISGYGTKSYAEQVLSDNLRKVKMTLMDPDTCSSLLNRSILNKQACIYQAKGIGGCYGDSGGPVVANDELVGIQSWVVPCAQGYPDVITNVYQHLDFINLSISTFSLAGLQI